MFARLMPTIWMLRGGLAGLLLCAAPAHASRTDVDPGPSSTEVDILRPVPGYARIFVQVELPDGELGLFLVDTGADISVLSRDTAERLGLPIQEGYSSLEGLSGSAPMDRAVLPSVALGPAGARQVVPDVEVAVGVRGMTDQVHFMPLDGLLGNNVWSHFVLEIDYRANLIVLHPPDTVRRTRRGAKNLWRVDQPGPVAPLIFDGSHIFSPVTVTARGDSAQTESIIAQIDTGAGELTLCAQTGAVFQQDFTEGLESIRGIGASETLPPHRFLVMTRRVPLQEMVLGGHRFEVHGSARWMDYDQPGAECKAGMRALLGHEYLGRHRVFFDYENGRMAVVKSRRKRRPINGHEVLLTQDIAAHGVEAPDRSLHRAKLRIGSGDAKGAIGLLDPLPVDLDEETRAEARVLLARLHRSQGDLQAAWDALSALDPGELVDQGEIIGSVNGLILDERVDEALALAQSAVDARPEEGEALVALADAHLFAGDADGASAHLFAAAQLEEYPDAHLLRRARVALARGDRYGSMAHVRKLLQLYPFGGEFLWFYAMLVDAEHDAETFRQDLDAAMARLHPYMKPVDFLVAAHHALGDDALALQLMEQGIDEMCDPMAEISENDADNCLAWFWSLAGVNGDEALRRIERALDQDGDRSDYLDTRAMVHLSRGELDEAVDAAWAAARLSPDDVYMLWQAERIADLRDRDRGPSPTPTPSQSEQP